MFYIKQKIQYIYYDLGKIRYINAILTGRNGLKEKENMCCELFTRLAVYAVKKLHHRHLLTFFNFDELHTEDISKLSFPIKFEKCLLTIRKGSRELQFSFFIYLFGNLSRENFEVLFLLSVICSEKLNKDLSLLIEPPPFNLERQHVPLLLDIFTF